MIRRDQPENSGLVATYGRRLCGSCTLGKARWQYNTK